MDPQSCRKQEGKLNKEGIVLLWLLLNVRWRSGAINSQNGEGSSAGGRRAEPAEPRWQARDMACGAGPSTMTALAGLGLPLAGLGLPP